MPSIDSPNSAENRFTPGINAGSDLAYPMIARMIFSAL
jgi:hypothetical protein